MFSQNLENESRSIAAQLEYTQRNLNKVQNRTPEVLIVDDDADSALLMESIFSQLGCITVCSLTSEEAKPYLFARKADIIILDWLLDYNMHADKLVKQCTNTLKKFDHSGQYRKPKIITFSSLPESEISLLANDYFDHLDHWQKPMKRKDLLFKVLNLLNNTGH